MRMLSVLAVLLCVACAGEVEQAAELMEELSDATPEIEGRFYELRTYTAVPGKMEALNNRFRNHTLGLFERHGFTNVGYWVPTDPKDNRLVFLLSFPDRAARDAAWAAFRADPDWRAAYEASRADGPLVEDIAFRFLKTADFWPDPVLEPADRERFFELRIYTAAPGRLEDLHTRFGEYTRYLFERHGMTQIGYWSPIEPHDGASNTLLYVLAYPSRSARDAAWWAFRADPNWQEVKAASEIAGPLVDKVESLYLRPTDYSPLR